MRTIKDRTFSVTEAAHYAGVHINTIRRWIKAGHLEATKVGGSGNYRILRSDLEKAHTPNSEIVIAN